MDTTPKPIFITQELTKGLAQSIYEEIKEAWNSDLAYKQQTWSKNLNENYIKVDKEADRVASLLNSEIINAKTKTELLWKVTSDILDVSKIYNDLIWDMSFDKYKNSLTVSLD